MKKTLLIFFVLSIFMFSGCSFNKKNIDNRTSAEVESQEEINQVEQEKIESVQNQISQVKEYQLKYTKYYEQKLVKVSEKTNEEDIIIENIKEAIPELKKAYNLTLKEFAYPNDSEFIFFRTVLMETDNPYGTLYSFDIKNRIFKKMNISMSYFDGFAISPDETRFALMPQSDANGLDQVLYICNLLNDDCEKKISLIGNETFNEGGGDMSSFFEIKWINDSKIEYSVFNQNDKPNKNSKKIIRYLDL